MRFLYKLASRSSSISPKVPRSQSSRWVVDFLMRALKSSIYSIVASGWKICAGLTLFRKLPNVPPDFDLDWYSAINPDVKNSGIDPLQHFIASGRNERRIYKLPQKESLPLEEKKEVDKIRGGKNPFSFRRHYLPVTFKRVAIIAHYDPGGVFDDYFVFSLRCYSSYFDRILLITSSVSCPSELSRVAPFVDEVCSRRNFGHDFMSWRVGYETIFPSRIDSVTFINDSVFGPVGDFGVFIDRQLRTDFDLFGASVSREIIPHVQSFYFCLNKAMLSANVTSEFWSCVGGAEDKATLIRQYEIGLTWRVRRAGFSFGAAVDLKCPDVEMRRRALVDNHLHNGNHDDLAYQLIMQDLSPNPMQLFWGETLRLGSPFVKKEILKDNPMGVSRRSVATELMKRGYDISLVEKNLERTMSVDNYQKFIQETSYA